MPSFYRRVWRWHFWAGLLACPVLVVVAVTGALYTFKDEIEDWQLADLRFADSTAERKPLAELLAAVTAAHPTWTPTQALIPGDPDRSTAVQVTTGSGTRLVYVNPYTAEVLGDIERSPFFTVVLRIHRSLFAGTTGRILVELATCWMVVLVVSGLYLWIPRTWRTVWGVWLPRLRGKPYVVLRDLHTVGGLYLAPVLVLLAVTGLFFTVVWVWSLNAVTNGAGEFPRHFLTAPPEAGGRVASAALDAAERRARSEYPTNPLVVMLPAKPGEAIVTRVRGLSGPSYVASVGVDRTAGVETSRKVYDDLAWHEKVRLWVLPVHMGSVFGWPTKVLAAVACLALVWLSVSGVWMWLARRPVGRAGFPHASTATAPKVAVALILLLGVVFPVVGGSILLVLVGEYLVGRFVRKTVPVVNPEPQPVTS